MSYQTDNLSLDFGDELSSEIAMGAVLEGDFEVVEEEPEPGVSKAQVICLPGPVSAAKPGEPGFKVRHFQAEAVAGVEQALKEGHKRICIVLPTGTGKTITSRLAFESAAVREACGVPEGKPIRVLFAAHMEHLLLQAQRAYKGSSMIEIIPQSIHSAIPDEVIEAGWDIVCIDEAHHEAMRTYQDQLEMLGETPIIGLTATPDRDDGRLIKFSAIVETISRKQAAREGYIAKSALRTIIDESGADKRQILREILQNYVDRMGQTLIFVKSHQEVEYIANWLLEKGYKAVALIGQSKREMSRILDAFSRGEHQFIVNCNRLDEGVDLQGCTDVVLARNFGSRRLLNQTIGRAARPDSPCQVWEFVDPLTCQVSAIDIIEEVDDAERSVIYMDHQDETWRERPYHFEA